MKTDNSKIALLFVELLLRNGWTSVKDIQHNLDRRFGIAKRDRKTIYNDIVCIERLYPIERYKADGKMFYKIKET